jgi:exopolysaccharide biosynthesis glucuronosyltransferase PssE
VIFVTIGTMWPFDRLIRAMDALAGAEPRAEFLAQIGKGRYEPRHMRWVRVLDRAAYAAAIAGADVVVAHAGIGSVVTAGELGKPIVVLPRKAALGEHTSEHQLETAAWLHGRPGVFVAPEAEDLARCIADARAQAASAVTPMPKAAPREFLERLRGFILE